MPEANASRIKKITSGGALQDLLISLNGKESAMLGQAGPARELAFLPSPLGQGDSTELAPNVLPVLLGGGLGHALSALVEHLESTGGPDFRLAVVDKESDIIQASGLKDQFSSKSNILWLDSADSGQILKELGEWQAENGGRPLFPIANPFYLRLDRGYYQTIRAGLEASLKANFWWRADYAKFKGAPRLLLLTSSYFLMGDLEAAAKRMGLDYLLLQIPEGEFAASSFVEQLLEAVLSFRPDFALTINHLGVDREGLLQSLLARLKLPLASWFVDNPHLILYTYTDVVSPWTTVFTWDADNLYSLRALGFEHVEYLPLATDHMRFMPLDECTRSQYASKGWEARVSFVGNSMLHKVEGRLKAADPPPLLREKFPEIAAAFGESEERSVLRFIERKYPEFLPQFELLETKDRQLSYEALITWEATLRYRLSCVKAVLPLSPLIAGDDGWLKLLPGEGKNWRRHTELNYYLELPYFYPFTEVNFNCTSKQMKGAVNQRIFDVPATGSFIVTDWREQMDDLFEPGSEVICYRSPEEATELVARYLKLPAERKKISDRARKRILAEHLYEHRLQSIIDFMRKTYA